MLAVACVQIVFEAKDLLPDFLPDLYLGGRVGVCFCPRPTRIGVSLLQNLFLLLFRFVKQGGSGTAHFRIQTGNASLSGLQFRQFFHSGSQFSVQLVVFPIERIDILRKEEYVLIYFGGVVPADRAGKFMIADFLRQ